MSWHCFYFILAMSIPDYNAPPPPPDAVPEEDYMNMRLAYSKR